MSKRQPVVERMQEFVLRWQEEADRRAIFLNCYMLMTGNVLVAIERGEFRDGHWVNRLLHRFAGYYFRALDAYEADPAGTPAVWRVTHRATAAPDTATLQHLFLGVNAHINYDLVLTVADMLEPEWAQLAESRRRQRYADHCHVNAVIGRTIDAVQDEVVERATPSMDVVDRLLGRLDEWLTSRLITHWRDEVWHNAVRYVESATPETREALRQEIESLTLRRADAILLKGTPAAVRQLL